MEIPEIKSKLTLATVLHYYGLKPDKQLRLKCPFHDDKTPSLQVYYKTHTAYCFSSNCKTHGKSLDVIDFVMYKESLNKHEAIKKAIEILGGGTATTNKKKQDPDEQRTLFLDKMFTYFKNAIHNSKPAQEYLQERLIDYTKTEVGYNSGQFHHGARRDMQLIEECVKVGLLIPSGTNSRTGEQAYKTFGKWGICFALRNKENQIVSLYFRSTLENKSQRHFYLKDRQGLYPSYPKPTTKKLILTESIIDAATLLEQAEINSKYTVLSLFGTNGFTQEHSEALKSVTELVEVIFFLNGDEPGIKAVEKYAPMLKTEYPHLKITHVEVPQNEDVNSLLQGHSAEILTHLIDTRKEYTLLFSSEVERLDTQLKPNEKESQDKQENNPPAVAHRLNTNNPYNLHYAGVEANYYIKGFKTDQLDSLKATLQVKTTSLFYSSKLDLYEHKQLESYAKSAGEKLGVQKEQIESDIYHLSTLLEHYRDKQHFNKENQHKKTVTVPTATATKCLEFLKARPEHAEGKNLVQRFNKLIAKAGIIGEEDNRILLFIIASSYKMPDTLHALIQGSSGSGKTRLLKIISTLMPDEDVKRYTRVTDNSFYNQDEYFFVNKLLCFEDLDGLKEDAQLAVRELQSNEILITSTSVKDASGSIRGGERTVRGPIASLACTTKGEIYEDNVSRSFLIAVDESFEQTQRVINYQNELSAGLVDKEEQKRVASFVKNCVRLLKPYDVINPYANKIQLPQQAHKIRRLNELYQSFVRQVTLLNQYQRKTDRHGRLITEKEDLQTACDVLFESIVLKVDELNGSLRLFFEKLKTYVEKKGREYEFNRFEIREATAVSKTQQHYYISQLVQLEYLKQNGFANRGFTYKIAYWDNMSMLKAQIKDNLDNQLNSL